MAEEREPTAKSAGPVDVEAIRKRCEAATAPPWEARDVPRAGWGIFAKLMEWGNYDTPKSHFCIPATEKISWQLCPKEGKEELWGMLAYEQYVQFKSPEWEKRIGANADFIAHAREDIPALLARVEELEGALKEIGEVEASVQYLIDRQPGRSIAWSEAAGKVMAIARKCRKALDG